MRKLLGLVQTLGWKYFLWKGWLILKKKTSLEKFIYKPQSYANKKVSGVDCYSLFSPKPWESTSFDNEKKNRIEVSLKQLAFETKQSILDEARAIVYRNKVTLFAKHELTIEHIDFNKDYLEDVEWPTGRHSSGYFQFDPNLGDIKRVWELNRFQFLNPVLTAYLIEDNDTRRSEYQEYLGKMINNWMSQCPHLNSVAWACSQETSIRLFNLIQYFWLCDLENSSLEVQKFANLIVLSAEKVYREIDFARAQRNNHSITESMALIFFAEFLNNHPRAEKFRVKGERILLESVKDQFYEDGSYIQNSHTYHRFALQSVAVASQMIRNEIVRKELSKVVSQSYRFLKVHVASEKGEFPNYGPNDGALLYNYGWRDYRSLFPLLNTLAQVLGLEEKFGAEEDRIDSYICEFKKSLDYSSPDVINDGFRESGYYTLSNEDFKMYFRCGSYVNRLPSQADMLHVDVWFRGKNILVDSGTYEYFSKSGNNAFLRYLSTTSHNTIDINNAGQMEKGPRFTWLSSIQSTMLEFSDTKISGEHYGFKGRVHTNTIHKRTIELIEKKLKVTDEVSDVPGSDVKLFWQLGDFELKEVGTNQYDIVDTGLVLKFEDDVKVEVHTSSKSLYYAHTYDSPTLVVKKEEQLDTVKFITYLEFKEARN